MASSLPEPPERHFGYECRRCRVSDFGGRRYSCWICPNFDVCGECYDAGQIPLTRHHLYYHPLEAHFDRREFRVYFEGEAYGSDMQALQSYKCALCDMRGMSGADLYRHLLQSHRDHQDYSSYIAMVYSHYLKHNSLGPCNAAETPSRSTTSQMLRRGTGSYRPPTGSGVRKSTIRTPTAGSVDIVNLLRSIPEMLDPHNDDLPYKCMEVVNTIGTLRAQQNACTRAEEAAAIGSYVRVLEQEILSRMSEWRQLREGRSSSGGQLMRRRSGLIPGSSASSAVSMAAAVRGRPSSATPSPLSTSEHARRYMDVWPAATRPFRLPPSAVAANQEFREALAQSAKSKSGETSKEVVVAKKISPPVKKVVDPRFLCPKLLANDKKAGSSDSKTKQLKANFIQAILCSMLADDDLVSMPCGLPHPINDPYFVEASAGFGGNRLENAWVAWNEPVFYYDCVDQNLMPATASDGVENPMLPVIVEDAVEHDDE
ncbi:uncharacterized protein [Drosophila bipectinata]|uniref:uncharacterized protein n=1 Tax=Drosophila bipectinata TaxID=42026 RepID=UPI0038B2A2CC